MTVVWLYVGFITVVLALLWLDLGVLNRRAHVISIREAFGWTGMWVGTALAFNVVVYFMYEHHWLGVGLQIEHPLSGWEAATQFLLGYLIEESLSLDNMFVIALIFAYFQVPAVHQHRVLFWGILGAIVMRGVMILAGWALINQFTWMVYVFGAVLFVTAVKLLVTRVETIEPERNLFLRLARRLYPVSAGFEGNRFFTRMNGRRAITPMFLVLLVVESTDLLFAVDSIPAIFAVTRDLFLVFTSNVFAILGLRSLYFVLAGVMALFRYLKTSLVFVLGFVGVKMILSHHYRIPTGVSLIIVGAILGAGILASVLASRRSAPTSSASATEDLGDVVAAAWKQIRRIVVLVVGLSVLLVGVAMIVLPGPAFIVIPAGLAILATEFVWAKRLFDNAKARAKSLISAAPPTANPGDERGVGSSPDGDGRHREPSGSPHSQA